MIICVNACDPTRHDKFGESGYSACCPKCIVHIGTNNYFESVVIEIEDHDDDEDSDDIS